MGFIETRIERGTPMPRGAEGDALGGDRRIGRLAVVRRDEPRHVHRGSGRCGLSRSGVYAFAHALAKAELLSLMRFINSTQDFTNEAAPSSCSCLASACTSMPAPANCRSTSSASPPSAPI